MALIDPHIWKISGAKLAQDIPITAPDPGWHIVGVGDFTGDRKCDILWRRTNDTLEPRVWSLDDGGKKQLDVGLPFPDPGWRIVAVGDFNGDGVADVLWRRIDDTGKLRLWLLNKKQEIDRVVDLKAVTKEWRVAGVGNFTQIGRAGILWQRTDNTGEPRIWLLNDQFGVEEIGLKSANVGWKIVGVGNFDDEGFDDILWRDSNGTGTPHIWLLDSDLKVKKEVTLKAPDLGWKVIGVGKFNTEIDGDNKAGILWRRSNGTGEVRIWVLGADLSVKEDLALGVPPSGLNVVAVGDFFRGGNDEILLGLSESCADLSKTVDGLLTEIEDLETRADQTDNPKVEAQLRKRIAEAKEALALAEEKGRVLGCSFPA